METYLGANIKKHKAKLDLSSIHLNGSQTLVIRGGEAFTYQKRKHAKTCNSLFITDKNGIPLVISEPIGGNHHDLFEIKKCMTKLFEDLKALSLNIEGLFLNTDAGFDAQEFRNICESQAIFANVKLNKRNAQVLDREVFIIPELYQERFVIERVNAWIDAFKNLIIRYETKKHTWKSFHYIAFMITFFRNKKMTF